MTDSTRRALLAALGAGATAGCLGGDDEDVAAPDDVTDTTTDVPTDTATTDPEPGGTSTDGPTAPDADHSITVSNEGDRRQTVHLRVFRHATGETVFGGTATVDPGNEREPYNLARAGPETGSSRSPSVRPPPRPVRRPPRRPPSKRRAATA